MSLCISNTKVGSTPLFILADSQPESPSPEPPKEPEGPEKPVSPNPPNSPNSPTRPVPPTIPPIKELIPSFLFPPAKEPPKKIGPTRVFYEPAYWYPNGLIFRRPGWKPDRGHPRPGIGDDTSWMFYLTIFTTSLLSILLILLRRKRENHRL